MREPSMNPVRLVYQFHQSELMITKVSKDKYIRLLPHQVHFKLHITEYVYSLDVHNMFYSPTSIYAVKLTKANQLPLFYVQIITN